MAPGSRVPRKAKPVAPASMAYILSQGSDLTWSVVMRSGPGTTIDGKPLDPKRPDFEAEGPAAALAAMEAIAEDRERFTLSLPGDRHALFVAVLAQDLAAYGC